MMGEGGGGQPSPRKSTETGGQSVDEIEGRIDHIDYIYIYAAVCANRKKKEVMMTKTKPHRMVTPTV